MLDDVLGQVARVVDIRDVLVYLPVGPLPVLCLTRGVAVTAVLLVADEPVLAVANSNGDEALDTNEKGFLVITLGADATATARTQINVEIRLEKSATLSIEISIPESMPPNTYVPVF